MKRRAYLTIDDSPSPATGRLCAFLAAEAIPALLYCRGDYLAQDIAGAAAAIKSGMVLGNHSYSHTRASQLSLDAAKDEIVRTEALLDQAYDMAGAVRPGKYFRFPHMDRGAGGLVVDYDAAGIHKDKLMALFGGGLNIDLTPPAPALVEKKQALQDFLHGEGFTVPFRGINHDWYVQSEMARAIDAMFTYSTSDWMITARHRGKWPYRNLDDLKIKIDTDPDYPCP